MKLDNVIEVKNLEKQFKIYYDKSNKLKEKIIFKGRNRYENRKVLNNISFNVKKGESIGLVGRNGCGKSTTLKLLSRIIYPDSGSIEILGRVSSLLELGAGFHPDMTGRENIYLNAAVFGLTKKEINKRIDEIISFSELGEFIDNPVRTYSSGMYMRLAFSVAINVNADILLIDEILGVGDVSFQKKCFERLQEIKNLGVTIVIVSHSLEQIERICDRCIWLESGIIQEEGLPAVVNARYYQKMESERLAKKHFEDNNSVITNAIKEATKLPDFCEVDAVRDGFIDFKILNFEGNNVNILKVNEKYLIECSFNNNQKIQNITVSIKIKREDGVYCFGTNFNLDINLDTLTTTVQLQFNNILLSGKYLFDIGLYDEQGQIVDYIENAREFLIQENSDIKEQGICHMEHTWLINLQ